MDNYFSSEITRIEKELTQIKTSMSKSAGVIQTVVQSVEVSVPLALNSARTSATGSISYRIRPEKDAIIVSTLNWYSENVLIDHWIPRPVRKVYIVESENNGNRIIKVNAVGTQAGENSDVQKLINGQSVSINTKLTIRATCNFTVEAISE